jgi:hypothetical protein
MLGILVAATCVTATAVEGQTSQGAPEHITALLFYEKGCCSACGDVETYLKDTLDQYYASEVQSGLISYQVANPKKDAALASKYNVKDWSLKLVVARNGQESVVDVPEVWMYVGNRDASIKTIKGAIDRQLGR